MEKSKEEYYGRWRQRLAKLQHYIKARFSNKEKSRVKLLSQFIPENSVVLDIGAQLGYLSKEFCRLHDGSCKVYSFEPVEYTFSILSKIMAAYPNAVAENIALSDKIGEEKISIPIKESGNLGIGLSHFGTESKRDFIVETIKTETIDNYVLRNNISRLDFIKCDVEGAELMVFKGGSSSLDRFRPVIYTELDDRFTQRLGYRAEELFTFMRQKGFRPHYFGGNGVLRPIQNYVIEEIDYVFLP